MGVIGKPRKRSMWSKFKDGIMTIHGMHKTARDPYLAYRGLRAAFNYARGRATTSRLDTIPEDVRARSRYAQSSYVPVDKRAARLGNAVYLPGKSTDTVAVYRDGSRYHVGIRGTTDGEDVISDINVAGSDGIQSNHSRVREVRDLLKDLGGNRDNTTLYGHSLGGSIATRVSGDTGVPSENFNTGASPFGAQGNKYSRHHLIDGDPISNASIGSLPADQVTVYGRSNKKRNPHTIDQFAE